MSETLNLNPYGRYNERCLHSDLAGAITEAKLLAALQMNGYVVLDPFGDGHRYDLAIEKGGEFSRIQCKTGHLKNGVIRFPSRSCRSRDSKYTGVVAGIMTSYFGDADQFGIYCPENDKCYLLPIEDTGDDVYSYTNLHVWIPAPNSRRKQKFYRAQDYELPSVRAFSDLVKERAIRGPEAWYGKSIEDDDVVFDDAVVTNDDIDPMW
jgi:hypothetical protein